MKNSKSKIAIFVLGGVSSIFTGSVVAGTTYNPHASISSGIASDATTLEGTITTSYVGPTWVRANATSSVTLPALSVSALTDSGKSGTVAIAGSGVRDGMHAVFALRTQDAFRGNTGGTGITGVTIELMNQTNAAVLGTLSQVGSSAFNGTTATLPIMNGGTRIGSASVPVAFATLIQTGSDGGSIQEVKGCMSGTLVNGNVIPAALASGTDSGALAASARTYMSDYGLRDATAAFNAVKEVVSTNTATSATGAVASTCHKPSATGTAFLVDHATMLRPGNVQLSFTTGVTGATTYTIPLNFRVSHV